MTVSASLPSLPMPAVAPPAPLPSAFIHTLQGLL